MVKVGDQELKLKGKNTQWFLKITNYSDELLSSTDELKGWPSRVKNDAEELIGMSKGALIKFNIKDTEESLEVFTTRVDTLCGVSFSPFLLAIIF